MDQYVHILLSIINHREQQMRWELVNYMVSSHVQSREGQLYYCRCRAFIDFCRSWKSVTSGVTKSSMDDKEKKELRAYAVTLIPQISQVLRYLRMLITIFTSKVLQRMPREMLLILKTNDLLRAIEHQLGQSINTYTVIISCVQELLVGRMV